MWTPIEHIRLDPRSPLNATQGSTPFQPIKRSYDEPIRYAKPEVTVAGDPGIATVCSQDTVQRAGPPLRTPSQRPSPCQLLHQDCTIRVHLEGSPSIESSSACQVDFEAIATDGESWWSELMRLWSSADELSGTCRGTTIERFMAVTLGFATFRMGLSRQTDS